MNPPSPAVADAYPQSTLHELFELQVARTPDDVAVIDGSSTITFSALEARANRIARHLRAAGVQPASLVGVVLERSIDAVAVVLGVLKAGAAYVPLDPGYPLERLSFIVADAGVELVVTRDKFARGLPAGVRTIDLDRDAAAIDRCSSQPLPESVGPDDWCFVVYTSGSTGEPKGVGSPHRSSVVMCSWMWAAYPFADHERYAQRTSLNFVVVTWEIFVPLLRGVPVVVVPRAVARDPGALVDLLGAEGCTRLVVVPTLLNAVLESVPDIQRRAPSLQHFVSVGEPLATDLAMRFVEQLPRATLLNLYGCSETHSATCYRVCGSVPAGVTVPIGKPLANRRVAILDDGGSAVPVGSIGELFVSGDGISRGYVGRPDLTRERFLPDPASPSDTAFMYRTGDLGRWSADGNIELLGRTDDQVQVRGLRVELAEVEAVLRSHPSVRECAVTAREDAGTMRLDGYFVAPAARPSTSALRRFIVEHLPEHMVPATLTPLESLPTTPNGKLDRRALPLPASSRPTLDTRYVAPRTPLEAELCQIWEEELSLEPVGVADRFFDLGGYSNKAVAVVARIFRKLGVEIPLSTFFELQTVQRLAERIEASRWLAAQTPGSRADDRDRGEID